MSDINSPRLMYCKAFLFLAAGCCAVALILLDHPTLKMAALLAVAIWCFARFYYFVFYVIQYYVDGEHRFSGLSAFVVYALRRRCG